jgi:hypothetical protein
MCKLTCKVSTTRNYQFKFREYEVDISEGAYNNVTLSRRVYPYMPHARINFDDMMEFKTFCEKALACITQIEKEKNETI